MDYVLSRPIYAYPYTINLAYYDTMVLIAKNYFSSQPDIWLQMSSWPDVVLLLVFLMCNFVVATTKLQSNNKNNNRNNKKIELFIIEQKMYVDWSFCFVPVVFHVSFCCCYNNIITQ